MEALTMAYVSLDLVHDLLEALAVSVEMEEVVVVALAN